MENILKNYSGIMYVQKNVLVYSNWNICFYRRLKMSEVRTFPKILDCYDWLEKYHPEIFKLYKEYYYQTLTRLALKK